MHDANFEKVVTALELTVGFAGRPLSLATRLSDDLRLGRFGRLRLALYLEEVCDLEILDEDAGCFETVADIVRYLNRWSLDDNGAASAA